jgi:hypothetical protein
MQVLGGDLHESIPIHSPHMIVVSDLSRSSQGIIPQQPAFLQHGLLYWGEDAFDPLALSQDQLMGVEGAGDGVDGIVVLMLILVLFCSHEELALS